MAGSTRVAARFAAPLLMLGSLICVNCLSGCGGDTGSAISALARAVAVNVSWDALTAQTPTRSAIVTIHAANPDGSDVVYTITRPTGANGAVSQTYSAPNGAAPGNRAFAVQFFTDATPNGAVQLKIDSQIDVDPNNGATVPIAVGATPTTLAVISGQQVVVGDTIACLWKATTSAGALVPIAPGLVTCAAQSGADFLGVSGVDLTGVAPGTAVVVASLGTIQSAPTQIVVTAP